MKQTTPTEKMDPLVRIQEEIKEVVRREEEYRQLVTPVTTPTSMDEHSVVLVEHNNGDNFGVLPAAAVATALTSANTTLYLPKLLRKDDEDEHHSDDSGISASASPVNGTSNNNNNNNTTTTNNIISKNQTITKTTSTKTAIAKISTPATPIPTPTPTTNQECIKILTQPNNVVKEPRYIGPNCYNIITPEPPQQKLMTRTLSTPHLAITKQRQFTANPAQRGVMQRFIASRGKLQLNNNKAPTSLPNTPSVAVPPNTPLSIADLNITLLPHDFNGLRDPAGIIMPSSVNMSSKPIERDAEGRPIRLGYVPVELKIQRELNDLKKRESELKKIRKIRQSTSDLLNSIDNENLESDDDDADVEHCYGPAMLRSAKSISEICETSQYNNNNNSISPINAHSLDYESKHNYSRSNGMRPAVSLATLCDLDPEEAVSSHRLIEQWENIIQQHA